MLILSRNEFENLSTNLFHALKAALSDPRQHEPQLVANLVWHLPRFLNQVKLSGGRAFRVGGVFTHGSPIVTFTKLPGKQPASVELGDLLLLRTSILGKEVESRHALLLQAKKSNKIPATPDNQDQHYLYSKWPTYEYLLRAGWLTGKKRHITGLNVYNGTKYLLLGTNKIHPCLCSDYLLCDYYCKRCMLTTAQPTGGELSDYRCFIQEIIQFIIGNAGKCYEYPPRKRTRNWDRVIEDLVSLTAERNSVFIKRSSAGKSASRFQGFDMHFLAGQTHDFSLLSTSGISTREGYYYSDGLPEISRELVEEFDDLGGVSIIEFVVESEGKQHD